MPFQILPQDVYICSAARTPIASINGSLKSMSAVQLGAVAAKGALERAGLSADAVEECIMGNVISAGVGQSPARQVALAAGCNFKTEALTINKARLSVDSRGTFFSPLRRCFFLFSLSHSCPSSLLIHTNRYAPPA